MQNNNTKTKTIKFKGETALEKAVCRWLNQKTKEYDGNAESVLNDLLSHGCVSGMVGELIYYHDTVKFFKKHKAEIKQLLKDITDDCGVSPAELFGDKWDAEDVFCEEDTNRNLLAWFGFEETARRLAYKHGIEV